MACPWHWPVSKLPVPDLAQVLLYLSYLLNWTVQEKNPSVFSMHINNYTGISLPATSWIAIPSGTSKGPLIVTI